MIYMLMEMTICMVVISLGINNQYVRGDKEGDGDDGRVDEEDDDHEFNSAHLSDGLPDVWVNHYFFKDLQAPC